MFKRLMRWLRGPETKLQSHVNAMEAHHDCARRRSVMTGEITWVCGALFVGDSPVPDEPPQPTEHKSRMGTRTHP